MAEDQGLRCHASVWEDIVAQARSAPWVGHSRCGPRGPKEDRRYGGSHDPYHCPQTRVRPVWEVLRLPHGAHRYRCREWGESAEGRLP